MRDTNRLLPFLAVRLAGLTCGIVAAVSVVTAALGMFNGELPLGLALGAALGFGRLGLTRRLFLRALTGSKAARRAAVAVAVAVANQLVGLALTAAFLVFCIKQSVWLFAGGAAGLLLIPVVIMLFRKKIAAE